MAADWDQRLSRIDTLWTVVCRAHAGPGDAVRAAQDQLIERYGGAIRRYLLGALRDPEAADELFQEFSLKLVHGDLKGADPQRGRFRQFVKGVLFHLVADFHKKRRRPAQLSPDHPEPAVDEPSMLDADREFLASWRDELLARAWTALEAAEKETGQPFFTVLRFRAGNPDLPSAEMAARLTKVTGRPLTAAGVRQTLHRARERFSDLLLDYVAHSLEKPTPEQLEQELIDLGLIDYCRPALQRRSQEEKA